jgi:hypothetical protein
MPASIRRAGALVVTRRLRTPRSLLLRNENVSMLRLCGPQKQAQNGTWIETSWCRINKIAALYKIEETIRGQSADARR